jgi:S1-C subfamily serine protease
MSAELVALSNALALAAERAAASVVAVHTEARGSSSGVHWRAGVIVTAEHALRRDEEIRITLPEGRVVPATLAGRDPATDLAVLRTEAGALATAELAPAEPFKVGSLALVVGRTRESGPVAALGVISLVTLERRTWSGGRLSPYVRLDVGLQPTASGGAVVDGGGRILGVATPRLTPFGAVAIPAGVVNRVAGALLEKGHIPRGFLGVGLQPVRLPEGLRRQLNLSAPAAVMVVELEPSGPATQAGVLLGDILVSLEGKPLAHLEDVQVHLDSNSIGKPLRAQLIRGGALKDLAIVVGERSTRSH